MSGSLPWSGANPCPPAGYQAAPVRRPVRTANRRRMARLVPVGEQRAPRPGGLVVVDKPAGITSHDVVSRVRRLAHTRRVGHAGTLDPMATGVLVLGVERATKLLGHLALDTKNCLVAGEGGGQLIATVGVENLLIVRDGDAILVADKRDEAGVKKLVELLKQQGFEKFA